MGFLEVFRVFLYVFRGVPGCLEGVPGFLEGVPGCSWFSRRCSGVFRVFHTVPGVPGCSGVPCSGVPGITTCRI